MGSAIYFNVGEFFNGIGVGYQISDKTALKINYYKSGIKNYINYFGYSHHELNESEISVGIEYRKIPKKKLHFALRADIISRFGHLEGIYYPDTQGQPIEYNHKSSYIGLGLGLNLNYKISNRFFLFASSRYTYGYIDVTVLGLKDENNYIPPGHTNWFGSFEVLNSFGIRYFLFIPPDSKES